MTATVTDDLCGLQGHRLNMETEKLSTFMSGSRFLGISLSYLVVLVGSSKTYMESASEVGLLSKIRNTRKAACDEKRKGVRL